MKFNMKDKSGFSLIELMIVVGIIGILASLAAPRLTVFMAKAKQAEAKTSLSNLHILQVTYESEKGVYAPDAATAGWIAPTGARYAMTTTNANVGTATSGTAGATSICKGQSAADVWTMSATKVVSNTSVLSTICPN